MSLNLDALRSFVVLAEELHFGRAAKRLYVSQPTLTKQIQRLEKELSISLFTRTTGQVILTSAGAILLERALELVRAGTSFESFAREASTGEVGTLRIGFGIATLSDLLPQSVIAYRAAFPKMLLEMQDMSSRAQMDALLDGSIDLGFVRMPVRHRKLKTLVVLKEELLIAVAASSAHAEAASLRDLRDEPFVLIGRSTSATYHSHALNLCASVGFQPNVVQEAKELFTVLSLVRAGLGVSLVPSTARRMRVPGVCFHSVRKAEARWDIAMAWRRDRERIVEPFATLVRATAKACK